MQEIVAKARSFGDDINEDLVKILLKNNLEKLEYDQRAILVELFNTLMQAKEEALLSK